MYSKIPFRKNDRHPGLIIQKDLGFHSQNDLLQYFQTAPASAKPINYKVLGRYYADALSSSNFFLNEGPHKTSAGN